MDQDEFFTPHFKKSEFTFSSTASRFGIQNIPDGNSINNLKSLCVHILEPASVALGGLHVESGYRSKELNAKVGGKPNSQHLEGRASDIIPIKVSVIEFCRWVYHNVKFDQLILEFGTRERPSWGHVSWSEHPRGECFRILPGIPYEKVVF